MALLYPLQVVANAPYSLYRATDEYFSTHHRLLRENETLRTKNLQQQVVLQKLGALTLENATLRNLLQLNQSLAENSVIGEILHVGRDPFSKKIVVNRGTNHRIVAGAAVVDAAGVIGQVTRVFPSTSEVTLITDKTLAIPIQIERNGLRTIAFGHGRDGTIDLPYLPANVDVRRGDKLVTSGIDSVYPIGLAIASVSDIKVTPNSPFARIVCQPIGRVEYNRQVLLVSQPPPPADMPVVSDEIAEGESATVKSAQALPEKKALPKTTHPRSARPTHG